MNIYFSSFSENLSNLGFMEFIFYIFHNLKNKLTHFVVKRKTINTVYALHKIMKIKPNEICRLKVKFTK